MKRLTIVIASLLLAASADAGVTLVEGGRARCVIYVDAAVMAPQPPATPRTPSDIPARESEPQRRRLRESVEDLALYLGKMSGTEIDIRTPGTAPAPAPAPGSDAAIVPILIGDAAASAFGPLHTRYPYHQAFRLVVSNRGVGLMGESDLATSYAIYELLDRLGCRWYMPSELGEVIPHRPTITLQDSDESLAPATIYRGAPPSDPAFQRRNRMGGMPAICGFGSVEGFVSAEQRRDHPDWVATVGGKPHPYRLRWSNPGVAQAIAEHILAQQAKERQPTVSFFVGGGSDFDESPEDLALDAGDIDPIFHQSSVSDRLLVLANRVADAVDAKAPGTPGPLLMMSAYTRAVHAPLRERAHAGVVPMLVASVYDRAHPLTDAATPGNADLLHAIEGWGKVAAMTGDYAYTYNLAEPTAPNPMITRWGTDLPILFKNHLRLWMPESPANFDTSLPGQYLITRLVWDPTQNPGAVIDRLMTEFYGHSGGAMKAYWQCVDDAWTKTPVYAGAEFGYSQRFSPEFLAQARRLMDQAVSAATTPQEKARVRIADESLKGLEELMALRHDLADGRWAGLAARSDARHQHLLGLAKEFRAQAAFANAGQMPQMTHAFTEADRISTQYTVLTTPPLRTWRYQADADRQGTAQNFNATTFDDKAWKSTDACVETWSSLGLMNYYGPMWYRTSVDLPAIAPGKKVSLWLSATDGSARVFVNGQAVRTSNSEDTFAGFCQPVAFDITAAVHPGANNQITILCERKELNELGTGGLMGPVAVYVEK